MVGFIIALVALDGAAEHLERRSGISTCLLRGAFPVGNVHSLQKGEGGCRGNLERGFAPCRLQQPAAEVQRWGRGQGFLGLTRNQPALVGSNNVWSQSKRAIDLKSLRGPVGNSRVPSGMVLVPPAFGGWASTALGGLWSGAVPGEFPRCREAGSIANGARKGGKSWRKKSVKRVVEAVCQGAKLIQVLPKRCVLAS